MDSPFFCIDELVGVISEENRIRDVDAKLGYFLFVLSPLFAFNDGLENVESGFDFFVLIVVVVEEFGEDFGSGKLVIFGMLDGSRKLVFVRALEGRCEVEMAIVEVGLFVFAFVGELDFCEIGI